MCLKVVKSFALIIVSMEQFFISLCLFVLGAAFGSFACCQAWRIRKGDKSKRSHCMNCKYQLKWYDNVPIVSWLMLGGKCRKCHKKIGCAELLAELGLAVICVLCFWLWPAREALLLPSMIEWVKFTIFLIILVVLTILCSYDAKWGELPVALLITAIFMAVAFWIVSVWESYQAYGNYNWLSFVLALLFLPALYFLLYKVSNERWVGGGDWILCIPLALMLGNMWASMFCLFLSNVIGSIVMLPVMIRKKKKMMIPFGPFLIVGFLVTFFANELICSIIGL